MADSCDDVAVVFVVPKSTATEGLNVSRGCDNIDARGWSDVGMCGNYVAAWGFMLEGWQQRNHPTNTFFGARATLDSALKYQAHRGKSMSGVTMS